MKVGYADIVGDLFHYNHIQFIKNCKKYCDYLIIGVCPDIFCTGYKRKPILDQELRMNTIKECKYVEKCIIVDIDGIIITKEFMERHNIDIVFHAHSSVETWYETQYYTYPLSIGKFKRLDYNSGISTSKIIEIIEKRS